MKVSRTSYSFGKITNNGSVLWVHPIYFTHDHASEIKAAADIHSSRKVWVNCKKSPSTKQGVPSVLTNISCHTAGSSECIN